MLENMYKAFRNVLIVMIIVMVLGVVAKASAQDVSTSFSVSCYRVISEDSYQVVFGYNSDGSDSFTSKLVSEINPDLVSVYPAPALTATSNVPQSFNTVQGEHYDWTMDGTSADNNYNINVEFTNSQGTFTLQINPLYGVDTCQDQPVEATPEPQQSTCVYSALDGATGDYYCYDLSDLGPNGQIPLPPPTN